MHKMSAVQMTSTPSVEENLAIAKSLIQKAASQRVNLIVLPEMFPIASLETTDKLKISETFGTGIIQDFLSCQAKQHKLWIVGGTIPIKTKSAEKVNAACLIYNAQGELAGRYDKIHLFDVVISESESYQESAAISPGKTAEVVDTPFGKLGLSVCYDIRFPELYRRLFNLGAEIFSIPAAFTMTTGKAHWEVLARSRAIENFCYVIGACQTGTQKSGRQTYGHSLIINPWGEVIASLEEEIGIITAEIDLEKLKQIRNNIPVAEHQVDFS